MSTTINNSDYNSDNFDLDDWNITLPVNPSGGTTGLAQTIPNLTDFTSPYFYANPDGSMTFMSPVVGATTANTYGARSELRELNPNGTIAAWNLVQGGTMSATLAVNSLPTLLNGSEGKVMIAQIHGNSGELIRLYDDAGKIYFIGNNPASIYSSDTFQLTDAAGNHPTIALNQKFSYMINAQGSTLTVKVYIGSDVYTSVTTINPDWQSEKLYFKAGVYDGDAGEAGTDLKQATGYGQTTFYGLDMSHTAGQGLGGLPANAPLAETDNFSGLENHIITGNLMANNGNGATSGPAGLALSVAAGTITTAHGGTVVESANGSFTYTPAAGFIGTDSFTYTVKDGSGLTSTATANITVGPPPQPPIAEPDAFAGQENKAITGNLMANNGNGVDTDPNGLALNVVAATLTTAHGGSVVENADGTFTYTPAAGYTGTDSFTYTLKDSAGLTVTGTASVTVNAPVQTSVIPEAVTQALNGVAPTPTMTTTLSHTTLDGVHGSAINVILASGSGNTLEGHDGNDVLIGGTGSDKLYGYNGNDVIYSGTGNNILNGGAGNDTLISGAGVNSLTGGGGNDVFVFSTAKTANGYDIITDFNTGSNKLDISALLGPHGTARLETAPGGTGLYIDPTGTGNFTLLAMFEGTSNVTVNTVLNNILTSPLQGQTLAPPVAQADVFTGQENHSIAGNLMADNGHGTDTDPNGLALSVVATTVTTVHGSVVENADGSFAYTAATGFTGTDSFTYTLEDSAGLTTTGMASVTVSAPPPAYSIPEPIVQELNGVTPTPTMVSALNNTTLDGVHGSAVNVILASGSGNTLEGHDGNDVLIGGTGGDKLYGYNGNDLIYSGSGNNILNGGAGNDTLISGSGANTLTGGGGNDVFVFSTEKSLNIHDIITDFNTGHNKLDVSALMSPSGTAQLETVSGGVGLYIDPTGTGHSTLLAVFEGTSNVTIHTALSDILIT